MIGERGGASSECATEQTARVRSIVGEMLVRESMANSAVVGLDVQMGPKVPSERDEGRWVIAENVTRRENTVRDAVEDTMRTQWKRYRMTQGERSERELLLNRFDSRDGDSYARANALQVNSQGTLRTPYSCIVGTKAKHFIPEEENSGTNA